MNNTVILEDMDNDLIFLNLANVLYIDITDNNNTLYIYFINTPLLLQDAKDEGGVADRIVRCKDKEQYKENLKKLGYTNYE